MTVGTVAVVSRYPVKSMAGVVAKSAFLGLHGIRGDRRFAIRRSNDRSDFPWLTAGKLPGLILYHPTGLDDSAREPTPSHVRTPGGDELALEGRELPAAIAARFGAPVELMHLRHGVFDDAFVSIITAATIAAVCAEAGVAPDHRRFRPNLVLDASDAAPFVEHGWLGGRLAIGGDEGPVIAITKHDERCGMTNLDPDTAAVNPRVLKAAAKLNALNAGVYAAVVRSGLIRAGDRVRWLAE